MIGKVVVITGALGSLGKVVAIQYRRGLVPVQSRPLRLVCKERIFRMRR
jgi:hypothetical protein